MNRSDFAFELPPDLIAQEPPPTRGASRLLHLDRSTGALSDHRFVELPALLRPGDLLVVNNTRVFPARLLGTRLPGGGAAECLLVRRADPAEPQESSSEVWEALVHPGQRLKEGSRLEFRDGPDRLHGEILARRFHGRRTVRLWTDGPSVREVIDRIGHVPLPPYIKRDDTSADRERYQTIYADTRGSIAAPTAGLHFTRDVLDALDARGIERAAVTLHVGYGTFQPIRADRLEDHEMAVEEFEVPPTAADRINAARAGGRRVIAVGTTTTRTLESVGIDAEGRVVPGRGSTGLFIRPGHRFRVIDGLITNFHLPESSLLVLASAFAGRERVLDSYRHAIANGYRFYSYGDANLIL